ncbi:MAG: DUF3047 domain-containing protein [Candidatus Omnitrophota bacterium]|nr:DUF3047 domain-containing protein [Candidatus Omnitrophota bacterium]
MKRVLISSIIILSFVLLIYNLGYCLKLPKWFPFNKENALDEWQEKIFKGKVLYVVKSQRGKGYLLAKSEKAASGIFYRITFDPRKYPMISWKWQVNQFPAKNLAAKSSKGWIERDDYAARFYVIFPAFYFMNTKCLEYVWDQTQPKGKILTSPYFRNIKLIITESGSSNLGKWVFVERNIAQDFEAAFGRPIRQKVSAIAIMTDADNTNSSAEANYSEIKVGYGKNEKE